MRHPAFKISAVVLLGVVVLSAFTSTKATQASAVAAVGPLTGIHVVDGTGNWNSVVWQYPDKSLGDKGRLYVTLKVNGDLDIQDSAFKNTFLFRGGSYVAYQVAPAGVITIWTTH